MKVIGRKAVRDYGNIPDIAVKKTGNFAAIPQKTGMLHRPEQDNCLGSLVLWL